MARLDELLHLGEAHRDVGDQGDERFALSGRGWVRARLRRPRPLTCGTTLVLVALSLVLYMPATLHGFMVDEVFLFFVSLATVVALETVSLSRLFAATWHGTAALVVPLAAASAIAVAAAGLIVRARHTHRRAKEKRYAGDFDAAIFSPVAPRRTSSHNRPVHPARVAPA